MNLIFLTLFISNVFCQAPEPQETNRTKILREYLRILNESKNEALAFLEEYNRTVKNRITTTQED